MRLNNQVLSLFIALIISIVFVAKTSAQEGAKSINLLAKALGNVDKDGRPSEKSWRGNRQDFSISKGTLSLNATKPSGRARLFTAVQLGKLNTWSGRIRFDKLPTKQNYAYILLSDLPQYQKESKDMLTFEYLALSIGGQGRQDIALVTLKLKVAFERQNNGRDIVITKVDFGRGENLIKAPELSILEESLQFDFKVRYDYEEAKLSFDLIYPNQPASLSHIGSIDWQEILPQNSANSFGLLLNYTKSFRNAMHFERLCITTGKEENNEHLPVDKPDENGDNEGEVVDKSIIITEVMPNPKLASEEYIELYNPNSKAIDLTPYQIGVGSSNRNIRRVGLRTAGFIPPKSYLVLSKNPRLILETYPSCPKDLAVQVNLPKMNNKGCYIYLYKSQKTIDGLYYDPKQQPRGWQSKRGLAWEREGLEHYDDFAKISWHIGAESSDYASAGLPNSKGGQGDSSINGKQRPKNKQEKGGAGEEISLEEAQARLEQEKDLVVEVKLYDLMGALLYEYKREDTKTFLKQPFSKQVMTKSPIIRNKQMIIALITLSNSKGKKETLALKGFAP